MTVTLWWDRAGVSWLLSLLSMLIQRSGGPVLLGALAGKKLSVAGAVDVDADGRCRQSIEDCGGKRGIAQILPSG